MPLRFFLDHNMSPETTRFLRDELGFDATDTREQGLQSASDFEIAACAARQGRIILTFDADFGDIRGFPP
ncbi:MAG: DUF5615 family PIN-like protein, partial [Chloroflexi bacterium]|nr:DUF5615 family PIN-like protein [Chloroflexota bacterium]